MSKESQSSLIAQFSTESAEEPTGCATRLQQTSSSKLMITTSHFIILVSLLAATFAWFQDSTMTIRQRQVQSQFTEKCISLRIPWDEHQICVRSTLHFNY